MSFWLTFIIAFVVSLVLVPINIVVARKYRLVDDPKAHKHPAILHDRIIPRAGGLAIFLAVFLTATLTLPISKGLIGIFLGGLILVVLGILDDRYDLNNFVKLAVQITAALMVVGFGIGVSFITNPLSILGASPILQLDAWRVGFDFLGHHSIVVFADIFAIFWLVWVLNMVNFSTGVDGQMPGIVLVTLLVIFATSLRFGGDPRQLIVSQLALAGAGATLGFLIYNFFPAKIFPGDSGSYFLGFLIAAIAILSGAKVGTAILVMAIPLIDGVFTVIRRIAAGHSPFVGDRLHLHHRLLTLGWGQRRIALFYWLLCAILGTIALFLPSLPKLFAGAVVAIIVLGGLIWLNFYLPHEDQK